jgi:hypothetical protein
MFSWLRTFLFGSRDIPCCCPAASCLCSAVPTELSAEFFYSGGGGSADVITITKVSDYVWTGSGNIGETPFDFEMTCEADGEGGEGAGATFSARIDCGSGWVDLTMTFIACNPTEVQFSTSTCDLESVLVTETV